jgi:hypothetical protein
MALLMGTLTNPGYVYGSGYAYDPGYSYGPAPAPQACADGSYDRYDTWVPDPNCYSDQQQYQPPQQNYAPNQQQYPQPQQNTIPISINGIIDNPYRSMRLRRELVRDYRRDRIIRAGGQRVGYGISELRLQLEQMSRRVRAPHPKSSGATAKKWDVSLGVELRRTPSLAVADLL